MANDIEITVDVSDLQLMRRELLGASKDAQKSASVFEREYNKVERQINKVAKANQEAYNSVLSVDRATKSASESAATFTKELAKQDAAQVKVAKSNENLKAKYIPLYTASKKYEKSVEEINKAHQQGVLTTQQYETALENLNADYNRLNAGANASASAVGGLGRSMSRTGVVVQQTGYQVGDFLVQVQSGTNWMVAFGQQATQVAGTLTMFGGKLLWIGSALGIIIPLVTALGAYWMRTAKSVDDSADGVKTLNDELKSLDSTLKGWLRTKEASSMGITVEELIGTQGLDQAKSKLKELEGEIQGIAELLSDDSNFIERFNQGLSFNQATLKGRFKEAQAEYEAALERVANIEQKIAEDRLKNFSEQKRSMLEQIEMQQTLMTFGENSAQAKKLALEQEIAARKREIDEQIKSGKLDEAQGETLKRLSEELIRSEATTARIASQTEGWANAMSSVRSEISSILSGLNSLGGGAILNIAKKSEIAALQAGASLKDASRARQRSEFETQMKIESQGASLVEKGLIALKRRQFEYGLELDKTLDKERELAREREKTVSKPAGGGGGGTSGVGADVFGFAGGILGADDTSTKLASLDVWYEEALLRLATFNEKELEVLREHGINKATIEDEYQSRVMAIKNAERTETLNNYGSLFGALGSLMGAEGKKLLKIQAGISAASTMISAYEAAAAAAAKAESNVERFGIWAAFIAKGVSAVAKIKAIGSSGSTSGGSSGGGGGGGGNIATPASSSQGAQTVIIEGIDANSLITGSQLSEIFDKLYEENEERGLVFQVAT